MFLWFLKTFSKLIFIGSFLALLIPFHGQLGFEIMVILWSFMVAILCLISHQNILIHRCFFVHFKPFFQTCVIWAWALHASYVVKSILIWELRRSECPVDWSMAHSFSLHHPYFKLYDFQIFLIFLKQGLIL